MSWVFHGRPFFQPRSQRKALNWIVISKNAAILQTLNSVSPFDHVFLFFFPPSIIASPSFSQSNRFSPAMIETAQVEYFDILYLRRRSTAKAQAIRPGRLGHAQQSHAQQTQQDFKAKPEELAKHWESGSFFEKSYPGKRPQTVCVSVHLREAKVNSHDICSRISASGSFCTTFWHLCKISLRISV